VKTPTYKIPIRKLGNSGLEVSAIGLGCMGMTFSYAPFPEKKDMINLIRKAIEQGINFLIQQKYMALTIMKNSWAKH